MATAAKKIAPITTAKRAAPNTAGVPGKLVSLEGLDIVFGKGGRVSPYDTMLDELAAAGPGKALRFEDRRAKASLWARGKKKQMRLSFAEAENALYVRFDGSIEEDAKQRRRTRIMTELKLSPRTHISLSNRLREAGDATVDGPMVERILEQMHRDGAVVKREGGEWGLSPKGAK